MASSWLRWCPPRPGACPTPHPITTYLYSTRPAPPATRIGSPYTSPASTTVPSRCARTTGPERNAGGGATLAVLLTLLGARVARQVAGLLQRRAERRIDPRQGARDAVADGVRLARKAPARDVHEDVEAAGGLGQLQRLAEHHAGGLAAEVLLQRARVDLDLAVARLQPDAGNRVLASTGGVGGFVLIGHREGLLGTLELRDR